MSPLLPVPGPPECIHGRATARDLCVTCGKPTRSHRLEETVTRGDRILSDPKMTATRVQCPDCGNLVVVKSQAVQCHSCYEKAKQPEEL